MSATGGGGGVAVEIGRAATVYGVVVGESGQTDRLRVLPARPEYARVLANVCRNLRRRGEEDAELLLKLPRLLDGGYVWARVVRASEVPGDG